MIARLFRCCQVNYHPGSSVSKLQSLGGPKAEIKRNPYGTAKEAAERVVAGCTLTSAAKAARILNELRCGWKPHPFKARSKSAFSAGCKAVPFQGGGSQGTARLKTKILTASLKRCLIRIFNFLELIF
ncbi:MAG: hypothetical protein ABSG02_08825 [Terriglobales bacterium]|jgi:hypothetical protein